MKPLSWNEIKDRALKFSKEWENETSEDAEAKSFWDGLFDVFGVPRRRVATFEKSVERTGRGNGYIDLLWKGKLLVEHKSAGKSLDKAFKQAKDYFPHLDDNDLPHYIIVCNFQQFRLYDLDKGGEPLEFDLKDLVHNVKHLGFIAGFQQREFREEDPVNIKAAELMGKLHDKLKEIGYAGHELEVYLVRLVFCLFADDTTIFEDDSFEEYIALQTSVDGRDLAERLSGLFEVLNTPENKRLKNIDEDLNAFPYVNGKLFEERLRPAAFDSAMRRMLLEACRLDWGQISPAIFGSLFQSVMNPKERRNLGAHYTSEKNIMKLIKPLFLDELWEEFEKIKKNKNKLEEFHSKLGKLRFLDPACGCGNFLVITYRELRRLELQVLKSLYGNQLGTSLADVTFVNVDQFYGIELEEFPAQISMVAMWLIDHQMNMEASKEFGEYYRRLPLTKAAIIINGNALHLDWDTVISQKNDNIFVLGNPPFIGKKEQNDSQKSDMSLIFGGNKGIGVLDYVTCWYIKAAQYIQNTKIKVAFVSTNSISQGEQVGLLWNILFDQYKLKIHFAHNTFQWTSEARGKAAVHVVIIGFGNFDLQKKYLYLYESVKSASSQLEVKNINPYLKQSDDVVVLSRQRPINGAPEVNYGSMGIDDNNLVLTDDEKNDLIKSEPSAKKFIRPFSGGNEFLNGIKRWCIWLLDVSPEEFRDLSYLKGKIQKVREFREKSNRPQTKRLASTPYLFGEIRQPKKEYILIPKVSSESREYLPIGICKPSIIASGSSLIVTDASLYNLGVLQSKMHTLWLACVGGRMKSDYQYSNNIVYNNYPWPASPSDAQKKKVEDAAQKVLDARAAFPGATLADLYDPNTMPKQLLDAHRALDSAVDACYRKTAFKTELERLEYLFGMYKELVKDLEVEGKKRP